MANLGNFTGDGVDTLGDYSPVPPGDYTAVVVESELLNNKNGTGTYIKLKFQIMGGEYDGRFIFNNITYTHTSKEAQDIGHKELNTLRLACKLGSIQDTTQLHGIAHTIQVKIQEEEGYAPSNVVKNYFSLDAGAPPPSAASSSVAPQPAPASPSQPAVAPQPAAANPATPDWAS